MEKTSHIKIFCYMLILNFLNIWLKNMVTSKIDKSISSRHDIDMQSFLNESYKVILQEIFVQK